MWKTFTINLNCIYFFTSSSKKYLSYDCRIYHLNHLLYVNFRNLFRFMSFILKNIFWKVIFNLSLTDFMNLLMDRFYKREIEKLSHYFSFCFPSCTFWESYWLSDHSFKLSYEYCELSKSLFILNFIELFGKFWIHKLNIWTVNKIANNDIILWPLIFKLIMTVFVVSGWIKSYWTYFRIKRSES